MCEYYISLLGLPSQITTEWLEKKKQKFNVSQLWRLKAQDQGFSRIGSLLRVVKENLVYSVLLAAGGVLAIFRTLVL